MGDSVELERLRALAKACKAEWDEDVGWVLPFFTQLGEHFECGDEVFENPKFPLDEWIERRRATSAKLSHLKKAAGSLVDAVDSLMSGSQIDVVGVIELPLEETRTVLALIQSPKRVT
jgi:hypothetical protein